MGPIQQLFCFAICAAAIKGDALGGSGVGGCIPPRLPRGGQYYGAVHELEGRFQRAQKRLCGHLGRRSMALKQREEQQKGSRKLHKARAAIIRTPKEDFAGGEGELAPPWTPQDRLRN